MARVYKSSKKRIGTDSKPFRKFLNVKVLLLILALLITPFFLALFSPGTTSAIFKIKESITEIFYSLIGREDRFECTAELERIIQKAASDHGVDSLLVKAVIMVESGFDPGAVSPDGAQGLMQLMPVTAGDMKVEDPFDPWENVNGGTKYLAWLLKRYDGDLEMALAAYNAGPKKVSQYGKIPPFKETEKFIERVKTCYEQYRDEAAGLAERYPLEE